MATYVLKFSKGEVHSNNIFASDIAKRIPVVKNYIVFNKVTATTHTFKIILETYWLIKALLFGCDVIINFGDISFVKNYFDVRKM